MGSAEVLMLEDSDRSEGGWRLGSVNSSLDALPYIDDDYANEETRLAVDKLIEEEMKVSSRRPSDFLAELPPLPNLDTQVTSCFSAFVY